MIATVQASGRPSNRRGRRRTAIMSRKLFDRSLPVRREALGAGYDAFKEPQP
jgi:hypothetical protein